MSTVRDDVAMVMDRTECWEREQAMPFVLDEEAFRQFYEQTARSVWAYLCRMTGDKDLADDLLQEAYYRLLRSPRAFESDDHRRNYLFRIATNLVRDGARRRSTRPTSPLPDGDVLPGDVTLAKREADRTDVGRFLAQLRSRDRQLLWLAYAHGASHREIGDALGLRATSIKPLLFRARQRLERLLRAAGYGGGRHA